MYSHPKGLVLLKVISSGKLKTNTCRLSTLFFVVWESPSSHPCQKSNIVPIRRYSCQILTSFLHTKTLGACRTLKVLFQDDCHYDTKLTKTYIKLLDAQPRNKERPLKSTYRRNDPILTINKTVLAV